MNFRHLLNKIEDVYGRKIERFEFTTNSAFKDHLVVKVYLESGDCFILKISLMITPAEGHVFKLWYDNIYTNDYIMQEEEIKHFRKFREEWCGSDLAYVSGSTEIEFDNKSLARLRKAINDKVNDYIKFYRNDSCGKQGIGDGFFLRELHVSTGVLIFLNGYYNEKYCKKVN